MRRPRPLRDRTGRLPFPTVATTTAVAAPRSLARELPRCIPRSLPRSLPRGIPREWPHPIRQGAILARSRRLGFYLDVLGAAAVMALFVAAAVLA